LGQALGWQGRFKEERDLLQHALLVQEKNYGPDHPRVALVLSSIGFVDLELNRFTDAEADFMRMLAIYRSNYGEKHQFTALALGNLGSLYTVEKQYSHAEQLIREALAIYTQVLPSGALNTAIAQERLGRVLLGEKRYQEAEQYSLAGYETIRKQASPSIEYLRAGGSDLVKIYSALGKPDNAARIRTELNAAQSKR
jgi:tetratricopeptide (TPR) repeat protein